MCKLNSIPAHIISGIWLESLYQTTVNCLTMSESNDVVIVQQIRKKCSGLPLK
jgi:hypothetical protein